MTRLTKSDYLVIHWKILTIKCKTYNTGYYDG
jgi:hypothetical protein